MYILQDILSNFSIEEGEKTSVIIQKTLFSYQLSFRKE